MARTSPYFHDGSVGSLDVAITKMGWHQLGRELSQEDVRLIAAWLECPTGDELNEP